MKQKTRYRSAPLNLLVTVLCLSVCAGSIWLYFKDLNSASVRSDKTSIATITFKYKIAQRKFDDRVVWERLQQDAPLYDGDTIRTADLAQATIHFGRGLDIDINENTMVQILVSEDGLLKLSVSDGQIDVDTTNITEAVQIDLGDGVVINLEQGTKLSAKKNSATNDVGINVTSGKAVLLGKEDSPDGVLSTNDFVSIAENGQIKKRPISVTSVLENQRVLIFESEKKGAYVPLEWAPLEDSGERVTVQTSETKDFSKIKTTASYRSVNKVDLLAEGNFLYWKIFADSDPENYTSGKLTFEYVQDIILTSPENKATFNYYKDKPNVNLFWKGNDYASKYKVEVGRNSNITNPVVSTEVTNESFVLTGLGEGTYYWRVTPYYSTGKIGWKMPTETKSFTILRQDRLAPPTLSVPPENKKFTYTEAKVEADFIWKGENADSEYIFQIARNKNFSDIVLTENTSSKSIHKSLPVVQFGDGEYYWRVTQRTKISGSETTESTSKIRKFTIARYVPEQNKLLYPENNFVVEKDNVSSLNFLWKISKENEKAFENEKTKIQFSTSQNFSRIDYEAETTGTSLKNVKLDFGNYYWRIQKGTSSTEPRTFVVADKLPPAEFTSPKPNETLELNDKQNVTIKWDKIPDAGFYKLKLLDADTSDVIADVSELKTETYNIPIEKITNDKRNLIVQVQAFKNETKLNNYRRGQISEMEFSVKKTLPILPSPTLTSPSKNQKVDTAYLKKNRAVIFKWSSVKGATDYSFVLYQKLTNGSLKEIYTSKHQRSTEVVISDLKIFDVGTFQWKVTAYNRGRNGTIIQEGRTATQEFKIDFTVPGKVETKNPGVMYGE